MTTRTHDDSQQHDGLQHDGLQRALREMAKRFAQDFRKDFAKDFARNTAGSVALWGAMLTPVLLGGAAFSVDASRLYAMDQDLQTGADALARAGASELDQRDDALVRATRAVQTLVRNEQKFAASGRAELGVESIRFLSRLPAADHLPVTADMVTNDPAEARYVEVRVETESVRTVFPTDLVAGALDVDMDAVATAGRSQRVCGAAPLFVCNPYEGTSRTIYEAMDEGELQRRQIQFKRPTGQTKGGANGTASWGPGSFGYLEVPGYSGTSALREAVGIDKPDVCIDGGGTVQLRTGNINSMHHGFNTRFDIYEGSMKKERSNPRFAPAANVVKGYSGGACKMSPSATALGLPRDSCHASGTCGGEQGNVGHGSWDFLAYMARNHAGLTRATVAGTSYTFDHERGRVSPATPPTRYAVYRWEIDTNRVPGPGTYGRNAATPEEGAPTCSTVGPSTADIDRRILYAAVLNCAELDRTVGMASGRELPVETFVKVFLTEPVGSGSESTIYGEIVGPVVDGVDSVASERAEVRR